MESLIIKEEDSCDTYRTVADLLYPSDQWSPINKNGKKVYSREFLMALRKHPKSNIKPMNLPAELLTNDNRQPMMDEPLGSIQMFGNWGRGSNIKTQPPLTNTVNMYAALESITTESDKMPALGLRMNNMDPYSSKGPSLERNYRQPFEEEFIEKIAKIEEKHLVFINGEGIEAPENIGPESDNSPPLELIMNNKDAYKWNSLEPIYRQLFEEGLGLLSGSKHGLHALPVPAVPVPAPIELTPDQLERPLKNIVEEYLNDCCSVQDCAQDIKTFIPSSALPQLVSDGYINILERSKTARLRTGYLFAQLIKLGTLSLQDYCVGLETVLEEAVELIIDIPRVWDYVAELISPVLCESSATFKNLQKSCEPLLSKNHASKLLTPLFKLIIQEKGPNFLQSSWNSSGVTFADYMAESQIDAYVKENNYEFLLEAGDLSPAMNSVPTPRRDDRGGGAGGGGGVNASADKKCSRNVSNDDGWSTASSRASSTPFTVQSDKLKNKAPMMDEPLGSIQMFGNWGRGSNIKTQPPLTNTANMYAAFENITTESDKRPALEGRGSRSGSQHRSRDSSTASQRNVTPAPVPSAPKAQPPTGAPSVPAPEELTPDQLERRLKNIVEEYLNDCCSVQECDLDIKTAISPAALPQLVSDGYISVLERSKTARLRTGYLFAQLIKLGTLSLQDYCVGLETVLEEADELIIDIPRVWDYVAELISPVLCEGSATFKTLHKSFEPLVSKNHASKLLTCLFKLIIQEKGPNFLQSSWNSSGVTFADYMAESQIDAYVKENNYEFLLEAGDSSPVSQSHSPLLEKSQLSYDEIHEKLLAFFKSTTSFDDIINWIAANVGERVKENQFIRTLATACFNDSIVHLKLKADILQGKYNLLHRFVDNKPAYELQCLFALQALINQLEHPQGLLLAICDKLYEENVFSHESFVAWEVSKDPAEQEGKGVALKQLTSFFTQLKEADEDSSSSEEA